MRELKDLSQYNITAISLFLQKIGKKKRRLQIRHPKFWDKCEKEEPNRVFQTKPNLSRRKKKPFNPIIRQPYHCYPQSYSHRIHCPHYFQRRKKSLFAWMIYLVF